tara:strand:- start:67 stop:327 length:261 start_codon:yes stop_codon:yes gene_type:complete
MIHLHRSAKLSKQDLRNMRKYDLIKKKESLASEIKSEENDMQFFQNSLNDTSRELSKENLVALHNIIKDSEEKIKVLKNKLKELTK